MTPDLFDLTGRVAVVTGGSRGLGREMVRAFAAAGADVVIASRKLETCEALAGEVRADTGRRALPVACHVGRWDDVDALVDTVYGEFGRVDVLVNNAGMAPLYSSLGAVSEELFDKVVGVNLKGPFRLSALVGERMVDGRRRRRSSTSAASPPCAPARETCRTPRPRPASTRSPPDSRPPSGPRCGSTA